MVINTYYGGSVLLYLLESASTMYFIHNTVIYYNIGVGSRNKNVITLMKGKQMRPGVLLLSEERCSILLLLLLIHAFIYSMRLELLYSTFKHTYYIQDRFTEAVLTKVNGSHPLNH